jgi:hypothetical protein
MMIGVAVVGGVGCGGDIFGDAGGAGVAVAVAASAAAAAAKMHAERCID